MSSGTMRRGRSIAAARRTRQETGDEGEDDNECPVCREAFSVERTKTFPFACSGSIRHHICSVCNRRMFERHDDSCPMCRASRSDAGRMGRRGPPPFSESNWLASPSGGLGEAFEMVDELFDGAPPPHHIQLGNGVALVHFPVANGSGITASMFLPPSSSSSSSSPSPSPSTATSVAQNVLARRRGRGERSASTRAVVHPLAEEEEEGAQARASAVVDSILRDPVVQAAIDGLRNPQRGGVRGFLRNVRQAAARRARNVHQHL